MAAMGVHHDYEGWRGRRVVDEQHRFLGTLEEVYLDEDGQATRWAVLDRRAGERPRGFIPLPGAQLDGEAVRIIHGRDLVLAAAAEIEPDGELTAAEEHRLDQLYGLGAQEGQA